MAGTRVLKVVRVVVITLVALIAILVAIVYVYASEPMDDMRARADALPLPSDYVLLSESYSAGALGFMGSMPHLSRTYSAPWPGPFEAMMSIRDHVGTPYETAKMPADVQDKICQLGTWYPAGWRGWYRGFWHYDLRLRAVDPEMAQTFGPDMPTFEVLYTAPGIENPLQIVVPPGRAEVVIDLIAWRGR